LRRRGQGHLIIEVPATRVVAPRALIKESAAFTLTFGGGTPHGPDHSP
jgi:hypothetical protein